MDKLKELFEYQRFAGNKKLSGQIEAVRLEYFGGMEIADDELDLSAAGDMDSLRFVTERKKHGPHNDG